MRRKILGITIVAVMMLSAIVPLVAALSPTVHLQPGICLTDNAQTPPADARYDRNPSFVVDDTGKYWLFYTRAENADVRGTGTNPDSDEYIIYYLTSEDEGTTWDGPTKLPKSDSKKPANFAQRDIAAIFDPDVAGAKKFFVFAASGYTSGYPNNNIYYYKGNAWNDPVQVIQTPSSNPVVGGHIDVVYRADKQEIWLFYEKGANGVYAVKSTDHGTTWSDEMFVAKVKYLINLFNICLIFEIEVWAGKVGLIVSQVCKFFDVAFKIVIHLNRNNGDNNTSYGQSRLILNYSLWNCCVLG